MAEIAGLVIGGISLAAIFDQCVSIIKYVDAGKQSGDDIRDAALMLTLIGGRLNRWERTIRESSDLQATEEDGETAGLWLKQIHKRLEEAEKLGQRYVESTKKSETNIVEMVQTRVLRRHGGLSLSRKARWALIDQDKMQALIDKLDMLVGSLEKLFPSLQTFRLEMLRNDVAGMLEPATTDQQPQARKTLEAAAAKVDKDLEAMVSSSSSHIYTNIENTDEALVAMGDHVSADFVGGGALPGGNHTYNDVRNSGKAVVSMGNMYGGKSIFEMQRNG